MNKRRLQLWVTEHEYSFLSTMSEGNLHKSLRKLMELGGFDSSSFTEVLKFVRSYDDGFFKYSRVEDGEICFQIRVSVNEDEQSRYNDSKYFDRIRDILMFTASNALREKFNKVPLIDSYTNKIYEREEV